MIYLTPSVVVPDPGSLIYRYIRLLECATVEGLGLCRVKSSLGMGWRHGLSTKAVLLLLMAVAVVTAFEFPHGKGELRVGHYAFTCPHAERIVRQAMKRGMQQDRSIVAAVLRLHFHDCFVEGCDGSVLLDGATSEKTAGPNLSLRGFELVDAAKADLEAQCPGVVSCADILAFGARDAVELTGGLGWPVRAGRLDGRVSSAARATADLPMPSFTVPQIEELFQRKGLSRSDMIVLSGAHTIGRAHCASVVDRVYPEQDPLISDAMAAELRAACPDPHAGVAGTGTTMPSLNLDSTTPDHFDSTYYSNLVHNKGLLQSDQVRIVLNNLSIYPDCMPYWNALLNDMGTRGETLLNSLLAAPWALQFSRVMVEMGNVQVKTTTADQGEIRRHCRFVN